MTKIASPSAPPVCHEEPQFISAAELRKLPLPVLTEFEQAALTQITRWLNKRLLDAHFREESVITISYIAARRLCKQKLRQAGTTMKSKDSLPFARPFDRALRTLRALDFTVHDTQDDIDQHTQKRKVKKRTISISWEPKPT